MKNRIYLFLLLFSIAVYQTPAFASHGWIAFFETSLKGKFIDAKTAKPLEGVVLVAAYRIRVMGFGHGGTDTVDYKEAISNTKGEFHLFPHVFFYPWPLTLGGETSYFIAYKPGYKFYESTKAQLENNKIIRLEPIPSSYYPRYEALEKAKGSYQYTVDYRKTKLLKETVKEEEKIIRKLDRYPSGVIFKGFTDEDEDLSIPENIAVDKNYIYIGDAGMRRRLIRLTHNGSWVDSYNMEVRGVASGGGDIALALIKDGILWATFSNCIVQYANGQQSMSISDVNCKKGSNLNHTELYHRVQVDKNNDLHFITTAGKLPPGFYIIDREGSSKSNYVPDDRNIRFMDVALDNNYNSYATFNKFNEYIRSKESGGILKLNRYSVPIKWAFLENVQERYINIAVDGNNKIYVSLKDTLKIFDSDLNLLSSIDLKDIAIGEIGITAIAVSKDATRIYVIDSIYNRILAYDLKNKRWVSK